MSSSSELPSHRACAACRTQKVRCILDDETSSDSCQRCARAGRPCYFTPVHKRKQRIRTDTRVAELEKEMRRMRHELQQKEAATRTDSPVRNTRPAGPFGLWYRDGLEHTAQIFGNSSSTNTSGRNWPTLWPSGKSADRPSRDYKDVVDRGVISLATARQLFENFRNDLFPHFPVVVLDLSTTVEELRKDKPALFLSMIAAAAGKDQPDLHATLDEEVLQMYATHSVVKSEKSLEMVQALLISSVWYHPPNKFAQLKYYEYIHMAATMAIDIGIGTRPATHRRGRPQQTASNIHPAEDATNPDLSMAARTLTIGPDTASIESRRAYLACYVLCGGVALSLRRTCMLRVSSYIRDCADMLERSPEVPTDLTIVAWARLLMIGEEISTAFSYDDVGGVALLTDVRTQKLLKGFAAQLSSWQDSVPDIAKGAGFLMLMYHTIRLYLYEVALHVDHSPEDFKAPYQMGGLQPLSDADQIPTEILADAISGCMSASHALMDVFFSMDVDSLRALPVFGYVRVSFAAFVLAKLCLSSAYADSRIGMVLDRRSLKVEEYMDRAILHVRNIIGTQKGRVPSIFLALLFKLRQWCLNPISMVEMSEQEPDAKMTGSALEDAEKPDGGILAGIIQLDKSRIEEHISSAETTPQNPADEPRTSLRALKMDAIGMTPSPPAGEMQPPSGYDLVPGSFGVPLNAIASNEVIPPIDATYMHSSGSMGAYYQPNMDFGNIPFPEGGLTGLDFWPDMDQTIMQDNIFGWPGSSNYA